MTQRWIVTALGKDRPGIVAGVAEVLYRLGCNLEDSAMTRLEREFAIMLIFSSPAKATDEKLCDAFHALERKLHLVVHLKQLTAQEASRPSPKGKPYRISVYGADRPGIVFEVSKALAQAKINITDVHTHRSAGGKPFLYLMLLEVEIPLRLDASSFEGRLKQLGKRLGVEISAHSAEADVL
jgi:glycine cleavage system transcriptional repressor